MIDSLFERTTKCPNGQGGSNRGLAYGGANPLLTPRLGFTRALRPGCSRVDDLGAHCPPSPFADLDEVPFVFTVSAFSSQVLSLISSASDASPPRISPLSSLVRFFPVFYFGSFPHYASRIVSSPFCIAPLRDSFLIRFVFSPRRVRLRFPQLPPQICSSSLRQNCSFVVLPHPCCPQATRCVPGFLQPVSPLRSLGSVFVARGRCRSPPTPLLRSGKVNRVRGSQ